MFNLLHRLKRKSVSAIECNGVPHNEGTTLFVDVRRKDEWDAGHIPWFRHIPMSALNAHLEEFKSYDQIFFICHSGGRSGRACDMLMGAGLSNARNVRGGMIAWENENLAIVR